MSVGSIIAGGFRLFRTQPRVVAIWMVMYVAAITLGSLAMRPFMTSIMAAQQQNAANAASGIRAAPVFPFAAFGNLIVVDVALAVLMIIAFAAVVRAIAWPTGDRFAYLRIGMDELRLIGLGLLLMLVIILAEMAVLLVFGLLIGASAYILGKTGAVVVGAILGIALFCAAIYAEVRVSLAGAFTVIEGRFAIRDAWRTTKGHFWTLFGAYLLMGLVLMIFFSLVFAVTNPQLLTAYAHFNPQALQAAAQAQYQAQASGITVGLVVQMFAVALVSVAMYIILFGAVATAAVELGGGRSAIAGEFR